MYVCMEYQLRGDFIDGWEYPIFNESIFEYELEKTTSNVDLKLVNAHLDQLLSRSFVLNDDLSTIFVKLTQGQQIYLIRFCLILFILKSFELSKSQRDLHTAVKKLVSSIDESKFMNGCFEKLPNVVGLFSGIVVGCHMHFGHNKMVKQRFWW